MGVDLGNPDLQRFPKVVDAHFIEALVGPGDVLFLPRFWWHHVHALPGDNVSLNFWGEKPKPGNLVDVMRALPDDVRAFAASRVAEATAFNNMPADSQVSAGALLTMAASGDWPRGIS